MSDLLSSMQNTPARRRSVFAAVACIVFIGTSVLVVASMGCKDRAKVQHGGNSQWQASGAKWQEDLLTYAIDSLNQMERFQTSETFFQIIRRIYAMQDLSGDKDKAEKADVDSLTDAWPEIEMLRQIVDRLNQWIQTQPKPDDWKVDPLVETLPKQFRELPMVKGLGNLEFSAFDGYALQEAVYLRDASVWGRGDAIDDLSRAKNLFDWTVRNIQLEADSKDRVPLLPWETMLFGEGTAMERAWVFVLLARQQGLDAAILALADPAENTPIARGIRPLQQWCAAVLIDKEVYLFDPALGLPIPAKDGIRHDAKGRLEIQPATLAEVIADPSLLKRLDIDSKHTYPVTPEDVQYLAALVEASPTSLSYRMKLIEPYLAGKNKMVLTTSASTQAERWKNVPGIAKSELWLMPYETIRRRLQLTHDEISGQLGEFLRFYALPNAPLSKGRLLHIKGEFSGRDGAAGFYQAARPSYEELGYLSELPSDEKLDKIKQDLLKIKGDLEKASNDPSAQPPPFLQQNKRDLEERMSDIDLAKMAKRLEAEYVEILMKMPQFKSDAERELAKGAFQQRAMQMMLTNILIGKQDATYWLGLIAYERGNFPSAEDYFAKRILEKPPSSIWRHGAFYNFARTVEATGQIERAAMIYRTDSEAPDAYGRQLRARWLEEKDDKK